MKKALFAKLFLAIALGCSSSINAQGMLVEVPLEKQVDKSSLVVEGRVVGKRSVWNAERNRIMTIHTVEVYKLFKGKANSQIEVVTPGGTVGSVTQTVSPGLTLEEGDVGVFTLYGSDVDFDEEEKSTIEQYKPYSSVQGFYKYHLESNTASNPFARKKNIETGLYGQITEITGKPYQEKVAFRPSAVAEEGNSAERALAPVISGLSPLELSAGRGERLVISGSGFGNLEGTVAFKNADDGGSTFIEVLDSQIVSWSDTEIVVEVPTGAGTGSVKVTDSGGVSVESTGIEVEIIYALSNRVTDNNEALMVQHIGLEGDAIEWNMNVDFESNTAAKEAFMRAFDTWRCSTGINWQMGATTTIDEGVVDEVNAVLFDDDDPLDDGVLGECRTTTGVCTSGDRAVVVEIDLVFNRDIDSPKTVAEESWYFGQGSPALGQYDFESVALHELGHGHLLEHVIDTDDVMHHAISSGETQRSLGEHNETAAGIIQDLSTTFQMCGQTVIGTYSGEGCNLDVLGSGLTGDIHVYPNPVSSVLYIANGSSFGLTKIILYDVRGRAVIEKDTSGSLGEAVSTINVRQISKGVYFLNLFSGSTVISKKIIVE